MLTEKTHTEEFPLKKLVSDKSVQMRASISTVAVQEYADAMEAGDKFPPIVVFGRWGSKYYIADGFHRFLAAKKRGLKTILATVHDGNKRDAMLYAMRANAAHGVRRSNADKQKAVQVCLDDREWVKWTDSEIASRCAVSRSLVAKLREIMGEKGRRDLRTYLTNTGEVRTRSVPYCKPAQTTPETAPVLCPYCKRPMPQG